MSPTPKPTVIRHTLTPTGFAQVIVTLDSRAEFGMHVEFQVYRQSRHTLPGCSFEHASVWNSEAGGIRAFENYIDQIIEAEKEEAIAGRERAACGDDS